MNKQEAQEYFQELKKMDKAKGMQLPEVIAILTNNTISINRVKHFVSSVASNQFGQYAPIYDYTQETDWKKLTFSQVYLVLKYLKEYLKQEKATSKSGQKIQASEKSQKDIASSFDSKLLHSHTVEQIIQNLHNKQGGNQIGPVEIPQEKGYEQKWKHLKFKLVKKLLIVFDYLRKSMHIEGESFDKNKQISEYMNLNMFMKYVKTFELGATFKPHKIIKAFKENAINTIWLDFDRFVNTNLSIINFRPELSDQEKYLRLRGLIAIISSQNIKKMLNIKKPTALATIVEGHTGTYKQDILDFLQQKLQERKHKEQQRWSSKRLKTEVVKGRSTEAREQNTSSQVMKSKSNNKISARTKSEQSQSIYQQLKLPPLRLKERKAQSIYESLKRLDLSAEKQRLRNLINIEENQQYLDLYLKEEAKFSEKKKHRPKKLHQLPPMRFT